METPEKFAGEVFLTPTAQTPVVRTIQSPTLADDEPTNTPFPSPPASNPILHHAVTDSSAPTASLAQPPPAPTPSNLFRSTSEGRPAALQRGGTRFDFLTSTPLATAIKRSRPADILRQVSSDMMGERQYYCQICLCNENLATRGFSIEGCKHVFCKECLSGYLSVKVSEAQVSHFTCPFIDDRNLQDASEGWSCAACTFFHATTGSSPAPPAPGTRIQCEVCGTEQEAPPAPPEPGCRGLIEDDDLETLLDSAALAKLKRFRDMRASTVYRECPRCQFPNVCGPTKLSNRLVCGHQPEGLSPESMAAESDLEGGGGGEGSGGGGRGCGHVYCFVHSDQHPGRTCRQWERAHRAEEKLATAHIAAFTRPCPDCRQPIQKSGGCNHMTCPNPSCRCDFCWLCGRKISGGTAPNHYAPWNVTGCPNMQMAENAREGLSNRSSSARMCCLRLAYIPLAVCVPLTVLALLLTLLSLGVAWFFVGLLLWLCTCAPIAHDKLENSSHRAKFRWLLSVLECLIACPLIPCMAIASCCSDSD